jgi:hypothetical protein
VNLFVNAMLGLMLAVNSDAIVQGLSLIFAVELLTPLLQDVLPCWVAPDGVQRAYSDQRAKLSHGICRSDLGGAGQ